MTISISARRAGLLSFEIRTAGGQVSKLPKRFLRTGGELSGYRFVPQDSGATLQGGAGSGVTAVRTGAGKWTLSASTGQFELRSAHGSADLVDGSGSVVAQLEPSGSGGHTVTARTDQVTEPVALLALLLVLARRRKAKRFAAAIR